jgi:hypothetical protein
MAELHTVESLTVESLTVEIESLMVEIESLTVEIESLTVEIESLTVITLTVRIACSDALVGLSSVSFSATVYLSIKIAYFPLPTCRFENPTVLENKPQ